jgi:Kef-type K+ transport system membrane component KefB
MQIPALLFFASPESAQIPLAMLAVFATAKILAELFERLGQPGIVGEILAGVLVGPAVLGWVAPNEVLTALADIGVMFLLFRVGLEVKSSELRKLGGIATLVAVSGAVVPFAAGWVVSTAWGFPGIEAVFVGAAMVATSIGITAQVLSAKGLLQESASRILLAAAVIDDVIGLLVLAAASSMARGDINPWGIALTAILSIGFVILIITMGQRAVGSVVPKIQENMQAAEAEFTLAIILLLSLSVLAIYAGVAAIVGAFFAGMVLSDTVGPRVHDLSHGAAELLIPFFLAGIGLHVDLGVFGNSSMILLAAVLLVLACLSKFVGCGLSAWRLGKRDAIRIGVGMIPRGEVGMVVAQIGLAMGVVTQNIYGVVVFMAVGTTIVAPPLLKLAFRESRR